MYAYDHCFGSPEKIVRTGIALVGHATKFVA